MKYKNLNRETVSLLNILHIGEYEFADYHNYFQDIQLVLLDAGRNTQSFKQFIDSRYDAMQFLKQMAIHRINQEKEQEYIN